MSGCGTHWDATASMGGCFLRFVLFIYFCLFAFLFYLAGRRFRGQRGITRGWEGNEAGVHNVKLTQNQQEVETENARGELGSICELKTHVKCLSRGLGGERENL